MPPFTWPTEPTGLIQAFETRHPHPMVGALFSWAVRAVESLHYLDDIDRAHDVSHTVIGTHRPDVVDVAHARWATGTCITALDLCAAGLGRALCAHSRPHELDLADFDSNSLFKRIVARRALLHPLARDWIDNVCADAEYQKIKGARDWLVHSRLPQHFAIRTGGPPRRLKLQLGTTQLEIRHIVEVARDVATRGVEAFLNMLSRI